MSVPWDSARKPGNQLVARGMCLAPLIQQSCALPHRPGAPPPAHAQPRALETTHKKPGITERLGRKRKIGQRAQDARGHLSSLAL